MTFEAKILNSVFSKAELFKSAKILISGDSKAIILRRAKMNLEF